MDLHWTCSLNQWYPLWNGLTKQNELVCACLTVAPPTANPVPTVPTLNPVPTVAPTPNPVPTAPILAHPANVAQINSQTQPGAGMHPVNSHFQHLLLQNQPLSITPVNTSSTLTAAPGNLSQTASTAHGSRKKALAQPLGKNWLAHKEEAYDFRAKQEDLKSRRSRMDEEFKRTVELLIYFKVCQIFWRYR